MGGLGVLEVLVNEDVNHVVITYLSTLHSIQITEIQILQSDPIFVIVKRKDGPWKFEGSWCVCSHEVNLGETDRISGGDVHW